MLIIFFPKSFKSFLFPTTRSLNTRNMARTKRKAKEEEVDDEVEEEDPVEDEDQDDDETPKKKKQKGGKGKKEKVETPVKETDFSQPALGKDQLKIVSWNVAGYNSIIGKGFLEYVKKENADIYCLQETKIEGSKVKDIDGYKKHFLTAQKKGYSGTGVFVRNDLKVLKFTNGIDIADHDEEGRVITIEFDKFYVVNTYIPNSGRKLVDLDYRVKWDKDFTNYLVKLSKNKEVIWCGDLNVAHQEIDLANPKQNKNKTAGFSDKEREGFTSLLKSGFTDTFRHLYPTKVAYNFWTYMGGARARNIGWRLDYFVISNNLLDKLVDSYQRPNVMGSDHCPNVLHIKLKKSDDDDDNDNDNGKKEI